MTDTSESYFSYANSIYRNLKSYIDVLTTRVEALEVRIITNYGVVETYDLSLSDILASGDRNSLIDHIMTGNEYGSYGGRETNKYPNVTPPNGSTGYLITYEGFNYNIYSMLKNSSGNWEYWTIASNVPKYTIAPPS